MGGGQGTRRGACTIVTRRPSAWPKWGCRPINETGSGSINPACGFSRAHWLIDPEPRWVSRGAPLGQSFGEHHAALCWRSRACDHFRCGVSRICRSLVAAAVVRTRRETVAATTLLPCSWPGTTAAAGVAGRIPHTTAIAALFPDHTPPRPLPPPPPPPPPEPPRRQRSRGTGPSMETAAPRSLSRPALPRRVRP